MALTTVLFPGCNPDINPISLMHLSNHFLILTFNSLAPGLLLETIISIASINTEFACETFIFYWSENKYDSTRSLWRNILSMHAHCCSPGILLFILSIIQTSCSKVSWAGNSSHSVVPCVTPLTHWNLNYFDKIIVSTFYLLNSFYHMLSLWETPYQ